MTTPSRSAEEGGGDAAWSACQGAHVLVVDDDDDMRELLTLRLREVGCVASAAPSGTAALALLRGADSGPLVDLILIDLRMPGVSGLEVLRQLVIEREGIPAILMTGFADERVRAEALALGIHILDKPFAFETLRRAATLLLISQRIERRRDRARRSKRERGRPTIRHVGPPRG